MVRALHRAERAADLPDELGRLPVGRDLLAQFDGLDLGRLELGVGVLAGREGAAGLHQVEDVIAPLDDLAVLRDDQLELGAFVALGDVLQADLLGVADEVELRR